MFLSLDGPDGSGKSTQLALLEAWLRAQGFDVVPCRDPGSTPLGEEIRGLLLERRGRPIGMTSEMLLYMAARAQLVEERIAPALGEGKIVLCDRFLLANVVYQGHAGGLPPEVLWEIGRIATAGVMPDLTLVLDLPAEIAAGRRAEPGDRLEDRGLEYQRRVRDGYLLEAARRPAEIRVIDAQRPIEAVQAELRAACREVLQRTARAGVL
jgi:dTMP kinase